MHRLIISQNNDRTDPSIQEKKTTVKENGGSEQKHKVMIARNKSLQESSKHKVLVI